MAKESLAKKEKSIDALVVELQATPDQKAEEDRLKK